MTETIAPRHYLSLTSPYLFDAPWVGVPAEGGAGVVAIGRLDSDSHLDVVTADPGNNRVSVYRGRGNGTFEPPQHFPVSYRATELFLSDVDHDGDLDVVGSSNFFPNVFVLLGNGDGTFGSPLDLLLGGFSAVGDVNGDGFPDLVRGPGHIEVLPGNGDGTFGASVVTPSSINPQRMALGDVNGDGKVDLAFTEFFPDRVRTALGNGDGTFADPQTWADPHSLASSFRGIAIGDMNLDGLPDLVTADFYASSVSVLLGAGGGTFAPPVSFPAPYGASQPALADIDHDGRLDVLVSSEFFRDIAILKGAPGGSLSPAGSVQVLATAVFALGDVDEDGEVDVVAPGVTSFRISFGHHDGRFGGGVPVTGTGDHALEVGDCNGDGRADLYSIVNSALILQPRTGPASFGSPITQYAGSYPDRLAIADLNGDGISDAALSQEYGGDGVTVILGNSAPGLEPPVAYRIESFFRFYGLQDLDSDGDLDILVAAGGDVSVLRNRGDGGFDAATDLHVPAADFVTLLDLDDDGRKDLLVGSVSYYTLSLHYADPVGGYTPGPVYDLPHSATCVATADLDGDGRRDVVVGGSSSLRQVSFLHARPDARLDPPVTFDVADSPRKLVIADFDGDGALDIAASGDPISILLGDGHGGFAPRQEYGTGRFFDVADFDDDGRPDIAGTFPFVFGSSTWLLLNVALPQNAPIAVEFDLTPRTLNLASRGRWVTGFLEPASPFGATDIDVSSIRLNGTVPVDPAAPTALGDHNHDGVPDLMVKFSRAAVELTVSNGDTVPVIVTGTLGSQSFSGTDHIRVRRAVVSAPPAGSHLTAGSVTQVRWQMPSGATVESVALLHSLDGGRNWSLIARAQPNTGRYDWTLPNVGTDQAKVAVVLDNSAAETGNLLDGVLGVSETFSIAPPVGVNDGGPAQFALRGLTPNPAQHELRVSFSLRNSEAATLALFDVSGRQLATRRVDGLGPGWHTVTLDGRNSLPAGLYVIRLTQEGRSLTTRAALVR